MQIIYKYNRADTQLGIVNELSLRLEIRSSTIEGLIDLKKIGIEEIGIMFESSLASDDELLLTQIVNAHQGNVAMVDEASVEEREQKIREMTEMAILHPELNQNDVVEYLTSVDNWFNAWKRCGIDTSLVNKITSDAADSGHVLNTFLNTVITPEGDKTFEFLISSITD